MYTSNIVALHEHKMEKKLADIAVHSLALQYGRGRAVVNFVAVVCAHWKALKRSLYELREFGGHTPARL